jgi:ferredoxin-thioredoxin reductase catalytic chain
MTLNTGRSVDEKHDQIPGRAAKAHVDVTSLESLMREYAKLHNLEVNPHRPTMLEQLEGLLYHIQRYGYILCPCRIRDITGDLVKDKRLSCPCAYHVREIKDVGYCKCELFVSTRGGLPDLISTDIHRMKVERSVEEDMLELRFIKEGWSKGEVKISYPHGYFFQGIEVKSENRYEVTGEVFEDGVFFFCFGFQDRAEIKLSHRKN